MLGARLLLVALASLAGAPAAHAFTLPLTSVTTRSARVRVINLSSQRLESVTLIHKYSDVFKDREHWTAIEPGEASADCLVARYHTGLLTLGRDWWMLVWYTNGTTLHHSGPQNFRALVDWMEGFGSEAVAAAVGTLATLPHEWSATKSLAAAMTAAAIAKVTTEGLFNSETTDGFKQHILRAGDEAVDMAVYLTEGGTVIFRSASGKSWTVANTI